MLIIPRVILIVALTAPALSSTANAQAHFEVASIHPSRPGLSPQQTGIVFLKGDRLDAEAATINDLLDVLNDRQLFRVVGGPAWIRTDRYDIHAKAEAPLTPEESKEAVLALLAERFHLVVHYETRDVLATALTAPKQPSELKPAVKGESYSIHGTGQNNDLVFTAVPMKILVGVLAQLWASPVVDQTGLAGFFDFTLPLSAVNPTPGMTYGDIVRESLFAFGFKVETKKVPLQITVVDRCERPSEN